MNLLGKLIGIGATAVAAAAAVKVAQKYNAEKQEPTAPKEEVSSAQDVENAGEAEPPVESTVEDAPVGPKAESPVRAALDGARERVRSAADKVGIDTEEVGEALGEAGHALAGAGKAVFHAGVAVAGTVAEHAPDALDKLRSQAGQLFGQVKDTFSAVTFSGVDADEYDEEPADEGYFSDEPDDVVPFDADLQPEDESTQDPPASL